MNYFPNPLPVIPALISNVGCHETMSRLGATCSVKIRSYERENVLGQYVELEKGGGV